MLCSSFIEIGVVIRAKIVRFMMGGRGCSAQVWCGNTVFLKQWKEKPPGIFLIFLAPFLFVWKVDDCHMCLWTYKTGVRVSGPYKLPSHVCSQ